VAESWRDRVAEAVKEIKSGLYLRYSCREIVAVRVLYRVRGFESVA
jgi:hypothetical protein